MRHVVIKLATLCLYLYVAAIGLTQAASGPVYVGRTGFNYGIALVLAATSVVGATIGMLLARRSSTHRLGRVLVGVSVALLVGDVAGWLWRAAQPSKFSAF